MSSYIEATRLYSKVKGDPEYKNFQIFIEPNRQEGESTFMGASSVNMQRLVDNAIEKLKTQGGIDPGTANLIRLNVLETLADDLKARGALCQWQDLLHQLTGWNLKTCPHCKKGILIQKPLSLSFPPSPLIPNQKAYLDSS